MSELTVRREEGRGRYEAYLGDEQVGVADFVEVGGSGDVGDAVVLPHVEVAPRHQGQGYASQLTRATLDDLRARGVTRIVPQCPYVRAWVGKHPDYQDLVGS
ncbi:GNAT family N-acetyltransferase [Allobranchiibius sp. CTAmp26]|uniref:GNAT family N-acetyltransferase n=1 Tax=Allobranchiibius sp. CTAmp26 TaxID=2815214 RepID=UPI001AA19AC2|nr:GNAT family N-acetyltransferase [Allobranchiibius sp. CTAmp26]MBO1755584.1 N-acetyltransferase [Allobranchiibius sp. CTAmp26]